MNMGIAQNAPLTTELIERVRAVLDDFARQRGKPLHPAVHVPATATCQ